MCVQQGCGPSGGEQYHQRGELDDAAGTGKKRNAIRDVHGKGNESAQMLQFACNWEYEGNVTYLWFAFT